MNTTLLKLQIRRMLHYLEARTAAIDHNSVMRELAGRAEISGSYLLAIVLANLIALLGLLVNSIAVVIGAMLISPLMGPIFSAALAFTTGDLALGRKALRNIAVSIALTVLMAAMLTLISPLKDVTNEIIIRTRPNIYDLFIAFFAGIAGAGAICTRKNYLFTTTGVAVATAVIPPLSVVGYGIGTWQWSIALGGFFLFFTNFVAIVLSSDLVFYIFRFRAYMVEEARHPIRRRLQIMGVVLVFLCIPLVYTLVVDIKKVKLTHRIESLLKERLDKPEHSRVTGVLRRETDQGVSILASINTVSYFDASVTSALEADLRKLLEKPVSLDLEQVIVQSGEVRPATPPLQSAATLAVPATEPENLAKMQSRMLAKAGEGCRELETFITPYAVEECGLKLTDRQEGVTLLLKVGRDDPFSEAETRWMRLVLEKKLGVPVELDVATEPLISPVVFDADEISMESRRSLDRLKPFAKEGRFTFVIQAPAAARKSSAGRRRLESLKAFLTRIGIAETDIATEWRRARETRVTVRER